MPEPLPKPPVSRTPQGPDTAHPMRPTPGIRTITIRDDQPNEPPQPTTPKRRSATNYDITPRKQPKNTKDHPEPHPNRQTIRAIHQLPKEAVYIGTGSWKHALTPSKWAYHKYDPEKQTPQQYYEDYERYLKSKPHLMAEIHSLKGKTLYSNEPLHCPSHGDILAKHADQASNTTRSDKAIHPDADTHNALQGTKTIPPQETMSRLWPRIPRGLKAPIVLPILIILALYAGPPGSDTLAAAIRREAPHLTKYLVEIDYKRDSTAHDVLNDSLFGPLLEAAKEGRILAITGGPNCRTWSKLLSRPTNNPKMTGPLRGREPHLLWGKPDNHEYTAQKVTHDNLLLLRMLLLIHTAAKHSVHYLLEHPADPGPPHPSWWITDQCNSLINRVGGRIITFDACTLGGLTAKATTIATNLPQLFRLHGRKCQCGYPHPSLPADHYEQLARWPWQLMMAIAAALSRALQTDRRIEAHPSESGKPGVQAAPAPEPPFVRGLRLTITSLPPA